MRQLEAHGRVVWCQGAGALQVLAQGGFGAVVPQTQAVGRDAALGQHRSGFDGEHRSATVEQVGPVHQMPVGGATVLGRILAHGRHHQAVGQRQVAARRGQGQGGKQQTHG